MKPAKVAIAPGARVRVVQGRQFQNFGAGDSGVAVHIDEDAGTCDVAFDGREGCMTVATRYLEADRSSSATKPSSSHLPGSQSPPRQGLEERLGSQRQRAGSEHSSSATDPNGRELVLEMDTHPGGMTGASPTVQRSSPSRGGSGPSRCVAEVLREVRRVRDAHRPGTVEHAGGETAAALNQTAQASSSAGGATANSLSEVSCLRQAFCELREVILLEAEQRVAGQHELGSWDQEASRAGHMGGAEDPLRAEQRRLEQKQAELLSLCTSLQTLKDQDPDRHLSSPRGPPQPADWELAVQLPLTARVNSLDARLDLVDERLSLLGSQVMSMLEARVQQPQEQPDWGQHLAVLGSRVEVLAKGEAQRNACVTALQAKFAAEVDQAQQTLRSETARLGSELRSAASEVLGKVASTSGQQAQGRVPEADHASAKLLESLQARIDALTEGLATEARAREAAVSQLEAQVRRACSDLQQASHKPPVRAASNAPNGCTGTSHPSRPPAPAAPVPVPIQDTVTRLQAPNGERPVEPRVMSGDKHPNQNLSSMTGQAVRMQSSADRTLRRLRAELGGASGAPAQAGCNSPRVAPPGQAAAAQVAAASQAAQPWTPRSGRPGDQEHEPVSTTTPGSAATTAAEEAIAPGLAPGRVMRMESSPVRQKSAPQATSTQRSLLRGLVGVDINHTGRADVLIAGLDLNSTEAAHLPSSCPGNPSTQVGGHMSMGSVQIGGGAPGAAVLPPGNLMSPSVPMMPLHLAPGATSTAAAQQGMSATASGNFMWPGSTGTSSCGPVAPGAPFMQPRV